MKRGIKKNQEIRAARYESKMLWEQAEDIADRLSVFLDATGRISNLEDWLDEYDLDNLGKAMDCLYDFALMYAHKDGMMSGSKVRKYPIEASSDSLIVQTIEEAYEQDGLDLYEDIDDYSESYFGMPASDIKLLYGLYDGSNEDTGIETVDGNYYIAYSGHGIFQCKDKAEMLSHFSGLA